MLAALLILVLIILVFGSLGLFVAKVFLWALLAALIVGALSGGYLFRGNRHG